MLSTPEKGILQSISVLIFLIFGIIIIFRSFLLTPDLITITVIIIATYTYSRYIETAISKTMIPELILLIVSILIFRIDEIIIQSSFTEILTRITSEIIVLVLGTWEVILILVSIGLVVILYKNQAFSQSNRRNWFYIVGISTLLMVFAMITNIANHSFIVTDSMSLEFYRPQNIVRIDIIQECSGIYGMMIFSCSFLLFGAETKRKSNWNGKKTFLLFFAGVLGTYSMNLLRIIIVINASFFDNIVLKSVIHSYLGSILILLFVVSYWTFIWKNAYKTEENTLIVNEA